jgi:formylmethanofuran dehydrogenase subunit B
MMYGGADAMSKKDELQVDQQRLKEAWQRTLPTVMNAGDKANVEADEADKKALRVHIQAAGHTMYAFDFRVAYVDSREIEIALVDVEKAGQTIDERNDVVQGLIEDYIRHLHECAQALHDLTHA